jgi:hypothetical protein
MSHSGGEVWIGGVAVAYFEYDGTSDIAISCLHESDAATRAEWRAHTWRDCECGALPDAVVLFTHYGGGFHWPAKACLTCRAITEHHRPWDEADERTTWPRDGKPSACCDTIGEHSWNADRRQSELENDD